MANRKLTGFVGSRGYDDIVADTTPTLQVKTLELKEDSGKTYEPGTVLVSENGTGDPKPVSKAITSADVIFVLAETADVSDGDFVAEAWERGCFAKQLLLTDGTYELTEPDFDYMRQAGISTKNILRIHSED